MQVTKGAWVGQTFALAKLNDSSGGKKSKRRSKEERKGMVETFVKRYQGSNNGNFPSLHLTHKEVGGSYYTVREIFRELIQENRVLAPPKLPSGEQNMEDLDSFLENYPLGSISFEPDIHVIPPKDTQTLLNEYEFRREKVLNSGKISELHRGSVDNDIIVNGSTHTTGKNEQFEDVRYRELLVKGVEEGPKGGGEIIDVETSQISGSDVVETTHAAVTNKISEEKMHTESLMKRGNKEQNNEGSELEPKASQIPEPVEVETAHATLSSEEFEEPKHTELLTERALEGQKDSVKEVEASQAQPCPLSEDVVVETFPLRPVSSTVYKVNEKTSEKEALDGNLELATGNDESFVHNEMHLFHNSTEVVDKLEEELVSPLPESKPIAIPKTHNHLSVDENILLDVKNIADVKFENTSPVEDKALSSPNGISSQNLDGNNSSSSLQQSAFEETTANKNRSDIQLSGSAQKQKVGATLNRINLSESWEAAASKKSDSQETNPFVSFIKTFVAAFVKFWSE